MSRMILGSHLSISGGLHKALESANAYGFKTVALFVRNQRQWKAPPLSPGAVETFREIRQSLGISPIIAHGSYLVNLAGRPPVRRKSIDAVAEDLRRCEALGIDALVIHPGSNADTDTGIASVAAGIDEALSAGDTKNVRLLLENTAGQGNCVGHRFEHLADILSGIEQDDRVGFCFDTAHAFAAGYDLRTATSVTHTLDEFDRICGLDLLQAVHCNDSKKSLGSHVDRHEHIGDGQIGKKGFAALLADRRLKEIPFLLETPKGTRDDGRDWDEINAETLRRLHTK